MNEQNTDTQKPVSLMDRLGPVTVGNRGIQLATMDDVFRFAKAVAGSQFCPPGFSETDCFIIIQNGLEVGMSPMAALASTYVVNNRATIFGDMPLALVRQSGFLEEYEQEYSGKEFEDDFTCKVTTQRKGAKKPLITIYSVADAKIAEVWGKTFERNGRTVKGPWVTAPKRMLLFRARGFNLRDNFGDVLKGCRIAELSDEYGQEPGLEHAKPAEGRVVAPRFDSGARQESPALPEAASIKLTSEAEPSMTEETVMVGPERIEIPPRRRPGRPPKQQPPAAPIKEAAATPAVAEPPEPKPAPAPPAPPPGKPVIAPGVPKDEPSAPPLKLAAAEPRLTKAEEASPFWKVHKRLAEEKISHVRFLIAMHGFGMIDAEIDDIRAEIVPLSKVDDKFLRAALSDWPSVLANLPDF